jgi:hypothetical protein
VSGFPFRTRDPPPVPISTDTDMNLKLLTYGDYIHINIASSSLLRARARTHTHTQKRTNALPPFPSRVRMKGHFIILFTFLLFGHTNMKNYAHLLDNAIDALTRGNNMKKWKKRKEKKVAAAFMIIYLYIARKIICVDLLSFQLFRK